MNSRDLCSLLALNTRPGDVSVVRSRVCSAHNQCVDLHVLLTGVSVSVVLLWHTKALACTNIIHNSNYIDDNMIIIVCTTIADCYVHGICVCRH